MNSKREEDIPMLTVENLSKQYKKSHQFAVKDVSFELNRGEIVGLIGGNGAGKTTIIKNR